MHRLVVFLTATLALAAGCGGSDDEPGGTSGELVTITSVEQFTGAFDEAAGHPRLVLLLSPT